MREPVDIRNARQEQENADREQTGSQLSTADVARANATTGNTTGTSAQADSEARMREERMRQEKQEGNREVSGRSNEPTPLFRPEEASGFRNRWESVQAAFVDDPRHAVEDADHLVAETIQRLAKTFADERSQLEHQWHGGGDVSTEDLRVALQKYRSFFERLLAA